MSHFDLTKTGGAREGYDDIMGDVSTSPTGASQWLTAQIGTTRFFINWLQSGQDDFTQIKLQMPHRKKLATALKSLHVHYILSSVPVLNNTVKLDWAWTWVKVGDTIPAIGSWTSNTHTITFTGAETTNTHYIESITTNLAYPTGETYSSILLFKILRNSTGAGADTYGGNFGLLYLDGHYVADRIGSLNETSE